MEDQKIDWSDFLVDVNHHAPCSVCRRITTIVDEVFEAPCCSVECSIELWKMYEKALRGEL